MAKFEAMPGFGGPDQRGILPIVAKRGHTLYPMGTGFFITASGLLMTAKHVVEEATGVRDAVGEQTADCELYALYASDTAHDDDPDLYVGGLLPLDRAWFSGATDIAICQARLLVDGNGVRLPISVTRLSPGIPSIGEPICAFGYHAMPNEVIGTESESTIVFSHAQEKSLASGNITEVYPQLRDRGFLKFPCMRTDAHFAHGMSGGPVFNARGFVCGVVTSGSTFEENSYASLLWPAMGCAVQAIRREGGTLEWVTLHEIALQGGIATDESIGLVTVEKSSDGKATAVGIKRPKSLD